MQDNFGINGLNKNLLNGTESLDSTEICFAFPTLVAFVKQGQVGKVVTNAAESLCLHRQNFLLPFSLPLPHACQGMGEASHMDTLSYFGRWYMELEVHSGSKNKNLPMKALPTVVLCHLTHVLLTNGHLPLGDSKQPHCEMLCLCS